MHRGGGPGRRSGAMYQSISKSRAGAIGSPGSRGEGAARAVVSVHWAEITLRGADVGELLEGVSSGLSLAGNTVLMSKTMGGRFWDRAYRGNGLYLGVGHRSDPDTVFLQFMGEAWELYGQERCLKVLGRWLGKAEKVGRVDIAFDGVPFGPEELYRASKAGEWRGRAGVSFTDDESRGKAAWIGKLWAGRDQVCLYDERGAVRLEYRTRDPGKARGILGACITQGVIVGAKMAEGCIRGFLEGAWRPLDAWLGKGPIVPRTSQEGTEGQELGDWLEVHGRKIALAIVRDGGERFCERLAGWAKMLDQKTLDSVGVRFDRAPRVAGRSGPDGYTAGEIVGADLDKILTRGSGGGNLPEGGSGDAQ